MQDPHKTKFPEQPNAICPICQEPAYCIRLRSNPVYFDHIGKPWTKHWCTNRRRPKLRSKAYWFEKNGWFPLIVEATETGSGGMIIHGASFSTPTIRHFGVLENIASLKSSKVYFRNLTAKPGMVELKFYPPGQSKPVRLKAYDDCTCLGELAARLSAR